jgi:muramoyltetrapeptide carboxypeptidase
LGQKIQNSGVIKPARLLGGETFGIIALSSPVESGRLSRGLDALRAKGFGARVALDPAAEYGKTTFLFGSASPEERANALHQLFLDENVRAILAVRGAYGAMELLPHLDFALMRANPKALIGFSDTTCLLVACYMRAGMVTVHGPSLDSCLAKMNNSPEAAASFECLAALLAAGGGTPFGAAALEPICGGAGAAGPLIGGNLSLLSSLMGTPWEADFGDHILFVEEAGEKPFRVHRMLLQMKLAGKFDHLRGVVFGHLTGCVHEKGLGPSVRDVIFEIFNGYDFPVMLGAPFGHEPLNLALPLGVSAEISGGRLTLLEAAVS